MKLVIDIPDEEYEFLLQKHYFPDGFDITQRMIHGTPYEERKIGKWHYYRCSECKYVCTYFLRGTYVIEKRPNYCPNCGFKMEVDE